MPPFRQFAATSCTPRRMAGVRAKPSWIIPGGSSDLASSGFGAAFVGSPRFSGVSMAMTLEMSLDEIAFVDRLRGSTPGVHAKVRAVNERRERARLLLRVGTIPRRSVGFQFVQKLSALLAAFGRIGTMDSVRQFGHAQRADDDRHVPTAARMCWITSGVVRLARSAATRTLESRTSPRMAGAMVHGGT